MDRTRELADMMVNTKRFLNGNSVMAVISVLAVGFVVVVRFGLPVLLADDVTTTVHWLPLFGLLAVVGGIFVGTMALVHRLAA